MNREELMAAIADKRKYIEKLHSELIRLPELTGMIQESIEFHQGILDNYITALSNFAPIGRPSIGVTKKVSITLPEWAWEELDDLIAGTDFGSRSAFLRRIIIDELRENDSSGKSDQNN